MQILINKIMQTSNKGVNFIKKYEGFKSKPYRCPAGKPTIGYGCRLYENGRLVTMQDEPITEERATELLVHLIRTTFEPIVNKKLKVKLDQHQYDMLVSHTFNTGGSDTLFKHVNNKDWTNVAVWWTSTYITSNGVRLHGLVNRRKEELDTFMKGYE